MQAQSPEHELGIRLANLQDFGVVYKRKKSENKYLRLTLAIAEFRFQSREGSDNDVFSTSLNLGVGIEKRKAINQKLQFIHGFDPALGIGLTTVLDDFQLRLTPSLGYILGFQLNLADNFYINLETRPRLIVSVPIDNTGVQENITVDLGLNSNVVFFSFVYQFDWEK